MLVLGIRYLNGFSAAAEADDMESAEWPPHPGRVFMALASAHFQTGADREERSALLWLEGSERGGEITAPELAAPEGSRRAVVKHYVPVNDKAGPSKAVLHYLPLTRERQDRVFARTWLDYDTVYLIWQDLKPSRAHRAALERLCAKVSRIGHSSSLVQMWLAGETEIGEPNWVPDDDRGVIRLRIAGPGTLAYLEDEYNETEIEKYVALKVDEETASTSKLRKAAKQRLKQQYDNRPPSRRRPVFSLYQGYVRAGEMDDKGKAPGTVFSPHLVPLRLEPERSRYRTLDIASTLAVASRWREAIISHCNNESEAVRSLVSGHDAAGAPLKDPHLAFLPMAFVGSEHADGRLLGVGLVLPAAISREERNAALRLIGRVRRIKLGGLGIWRLLPVTESRPPWNLRPEAWTGYPEGATHWSSVTPVALDRHPKAKNKAEHRLELANMIARSCERISLPKPREVIVTPVSAHLGAPPGYAFPKLKRKDGSERRHIHVILVFEEPVCGPLLIGAGRFRGYGVCRPMDGLI